MREDTEKMAKEAGVDWKATGYLVSIVSVLLLGAVAAGKEHPPSWYYSCLILGMLTSITGMGCRYMAHLHEKREIKEAKSGKRR
jgi:hypothetical protein